MTYDEVKETLNAYLKKRRLVEIYKERLKMALEDAESLPAVDYSKDRVNGGDVPCSVQERAILRVDDLKEKHEHLFTELFALEDEISAMLPYLNDVEQGLIIDRYMQGASFVQLSRKYFYGYDVLKNKFTKIYRKISSGYQK